MTKKALKITVIILGFLGLLLIGSFFFAVNALPSQSELGAMLKKPAAKPAVAPSVNQQVQDTGAQPPVEETEAELEPYIPSTQGKAETSPETMEKIKAFISEDPKDIRVCSNLMKAKAKKKEDVNIVNIFGDENREDPFFEAIRVPIKAIFQDPSVVELFSEVETLTTNQEATKETGSLLSKAAFYAKAAKTAAQLYQQKSYFEQLGDRAEHLSVLSKLAALKPEMANDSRVYDYCLSVENSLKFNEEASVKEERSALLQLLTELGVQPSELDFKPESFNKFAIKLDQNNLEFSLKGE